jgi:hypothetical protein
MKHVLFASIIFMMISVPAVADDDPFLIELDRRYDNTVEMIFNECTADAEYVKSVAERRDAGETLDATIEQMFTDITNPRNKITGGVPTTANVLGQVVLITMIFTNPNLSHEEIYLQQFKYCTDDSMQYLTMLYERAKEIYREQKATK